ncbi:MAG: YicC family protein [Lachnospiraceae bacterium]|nr:YicC family protein [Lachnospiraceae bacterium]
MIKSMTGFGRAEENVHNRKFTVEIKSVNHRYLDVSIKMPKKLNFFETSIRTELKEYISRGKVDVFITYEDMTETASFVKYNKDTARQYLEHLRQMAEDFGLDNDVRVSTLSRYPDIFTLEEKAENEDEIWADLKHCIDKACRMFVDTRIAEGENLKNDLLEKLNGMSDVVSFIEERSPRIIEEYRSKINDRVKEILGDTKVDEGRLLTEVTIFADKVCVDEEIVRLKSHIGAVKDELSEGGSIGRKLDFIAQEMNREANTILSKTTDLEISNKGIILKTEIEKVREQIQNIE